MTGLMILYHKNLFSETPLGIDRARTLELCYSLHSEEKGNGVSLPITSDPV
jgi:hypothetical protein